MQIVSRKLPESNKVYARRHNDELALNAKALRLAQAFVTTILNKNMRFTAFSGAK
jgi:hypothetical protein